MKLKNVLIVVKDIEKARQFYHDLFGLTMILDNEGNMILTEGLVLQDEKIWKEFLGRDIIPETDSRTTQENIEFSKKILDQMDDRKYTALVTSNYHVYRALRYCKKAGLKCTGIGSHVALYFWPSALIREFIAIHAEKKHAVLFIAGWLVCISPMLLVLIGELFS